MDEGGGPAIDDYVRLVLLSDCLISLLLAATLSRLPLLDRGWLAAMWGLAPVAAAITWPRTADLQFAIGAAAAAAAAMLDVGGPNIRTQPKPVILST